MKKLLTALLIAIPAILFSQLPAPLKNTYVHDYARTLTAEETEFLNRQIKAIDTTNSIKFAIVLINDLPADYAIEDYARDIGNKWQVGKGVVYVAALNNRKQRLEVSSHLEGVIPDAIAGHILARVKIHFRNKDYYAGLSGMVSEINALVKADGAIVKPKEEEEKSNGYAIILISVVFTSVAAWIISAIYRTKAKEKRLKEYNKKLEEYKKAEEAEVNAGTHNSKPKSIYTPQKTQYIPPDDTSYNSKKNKDDNSGSYFSGYSSGSSSSSDDSYSRNRNNDSGSSYGGYGDSSSSDSYSGGGASSDW